MRLIRQSAIAICLFAATLAQAEPFRPQFHFTPQRNWMNDPNGMVFYEGEWHLFYQYNPEGEKWGHMSWGHAVSRNLIHWEHLPLALPERDGVMAFSGSAVVDWQNTSGFGKNGKPPLVAIYTGHREKHQDQRLAYSNDRGRTWTSYEGNPVLDIGLADFRDPKVFWYESKRRWIMVLALSTEKKVSFYESPDLKSWKHLSDFGPAGSTIGLWECPDLFPLPIETESGASKWVLIVNVNPGAPAGGSGTQYFVGEFDGGKFIADRVDASKARPSAARTLADFEGADYGAWKASGPAFGIRPSQPATDSVRGMDGKGIADSFGGNDSSEGTLTSPNFTIDANYLHFSIGGGSHPDELGIRLLVDGKLVRSATGNNSPQLEKQSWDLRQWRGKTARIELFDICTRDDWGHILLDGIALADSPDASSNEDALWADFGADFYAAVSWCDVPKPDGRRIWLAWMSNWNYAQEVPTSPWRSAMTIPRTLALRRTLEGLRLIQLPVAELAALHRKPALKFRGGTFAEAATWLAKQNDLPPQLDVSLTFSRISRNTSFSLGIASEHNQQTLVVCDPGSARITLDRTKSGETAFHRTFPGRHHAPLRVVDGRVTLRLLLDASSLEIFAQDGETSITDLIFPSGSTRTLSLSGSNVDSLVVQEIVLHPLIAP